jgi:hypothetical protein
MLKLRRFCSFLLPFLSFVLRPYPFVTTFLLPCSLYSLYFSFLPSLFVPPTSHPTTLLPSSTSPTTNHYTSCLSIYLPSSSVCLSFNLMSICLSSSPPSIPSVYPPFSTSNKWPVYVSADRRVARSVINPVKGRPITLSIGRSTTFPVAQQCSRPVRLYPKHSTKNKTKLFSFQYEVYSPLFVIYTFYLFKGSNTREKEEGNTLRCSSVQCSAVAV